MIIEVNRRPSKLETTIGAMLIDGQHFSHTLEDEVRPDGEKIAGKTAIPAGEYLVTVTMSNRFKRMMPLLYNTSRATVKKGSVEFAGVRIHGGNTHFDTDGCILVAKNLISDTRIQGTMEAELTKRIQAALLSKTLYEIKCTETGQLLRGKVKLVVKNG